MTKQVSGRTREERRKRARADLQAWVRIPAFYAVLAIILTAITFVINSYGIPSSEYDLNAAKPQTVLFATFVNDSWNHLSGNLYAMMILVTTTLIPMFGNPSVGRSKRFHELVCWGALLSGLAGAATYYLILVVRGIGPDGAGSSIVNAALLGIVLVLTAFSFLHNIRHKNIAASILATILVAALLGEFIQGFLGAGNTGAHLLGFLVGVGAAIWFSGRETNGQA